MKASGKKRAAKEPKRATVAKRWASSSDPLYGLFQTTFPPLEIAEPKPLKSPFPEITTDEERDYWRTVLYLEALKEYAYRAVFDNDPFIRGVMRDHAMHHLLAGPHVPEPVRAWLLYLLTRIKDLPREGSGPEHDREKHLERCARLRETCAAAPRGEPITETLRRAADGLHMSYSAVRTLYYSEAFRVDRYFLAHPFSINSPPE